MNLHIGTQISPLLKHTHCGEVNILFSPGPIYSDGHKLPLVITTVIHLGWSSSYKAFYTLLYPSINTLLCVTTPSLVTFIYHTFPDNFFYTFNFYSLKGFLLLLFIYLWWLLLSKNNTCSLANNMHIMFCVSGPFLSHFKFKIKSQIFFNEQIYYSQNPSKCFHHYSLSLQISEIINSVQYLIRF
jgi:hypothetical protein